MHYVSHLSNDTKLKLLIEEQGALPLKKRKDVFNILCASIMSQQLSTKVARVFHERFLKLYLGKMPTPEQLLETPFETLRGIGLSNAKASYIQNIARFAIEQGLEYRKLQQLSNEEIMNYLMQIKGVGRWTVQMQLMFTFGREDVFPYDDLGIQLSMIKLYDIRWRNKKRLIEKLNRIADGWSPYRTYACMHLWHWKDKGK